MKTRAVLKTAADLLMTAAIPVLMCYSLVGEKAHEYVGIAIFALFILHHILNFGWIKSLFKGRYTLRRIVNTLVNVLVLVCMLGQMYSSLVISNHIFTFLDLNGAGFARTVHLLCAYWSLVLMSTHLGMHIAQVASRISLKNKKLLWSLRILFAIIAVVGIYEFIQLKLTDYLFGKVQFVFIDMTASVVLAVLKYASVMVLCAYIGYIIDTIPKKSSINK